MFGLCLRADRYQYHLLIPYASMSILQHDIALAAGGEELADYVKEYTICDTTDDFIRHDKRGKTLRKAYAKEHGRNAARLFDFLNSSYIAGKISYTVCQVLADVMRSDGFDRTKVYGFEEGVTAENLLALLDYCVKNHKDFSWS